jgi:hypothetical protein
MMKYQALPAPEKIIWQIEKEQLVRMKAKVKWEN